MPARTHRRSRRAPLLAALTAACTPGLGTPQVTVTPEHPTATDDLVARVQVPGADGGLVLSWTWFRDDVPVPWLASGVVPASELRRGEVWRVQVAATDDRTESPLGSATAVIRNARPQATLTLTPDPVRSDEPLLATVTAHDVDGDPVTVSFSWTADGAPVPLDGPVLPAGTVRRGQHLRVEAIPHDGQDAGAPAVAEVKVENGAPVVRAVTFAAPPSRAEPLAALVDAHDPDGDPVALAWAWTVNAQPAGDGPTLPTDRYRRGDTVALTVTPSDGTLEGTPATLGPTVVQNAPPRVLGVRLAPTAPDETSVLTCTAERLLDGDDDPVTLTRTWTVDGVVLEGAPEALDGAWFDRDQVVGCTLEPADPFQAGAPASARVTVRNALPTLAWAAVDNVRPGTGEPLALRLGPTADADGDPVALQVAWFVDDQPVATGPTLPALHFRPGDPVYAVVTPHDGRQAGVPVTTPTVTVSNLPPQVDAVWLEPAVPTAETDVRAVVHASDPNGDPVTLTHAWTVDGVPVAGIDGPTLPGTHVVRGDRVAVAVTPSDGALTGLPVTSAPVVVGNSVPRVVGARISPPMPTVASPPRCEPVDWLDLDGDPPGFARSWEVDGAPVPATGEVLEPAWYARGQTVACTLVPTDGLDWGDLVTSPPVVVGNAPPSVQGVTIGPAAPREDSVLWATHGDLTDPDPDDAHQLSVTWTWYVDGVEVPGVHTPHLTGAWFDAGDLVWARATPFDGTDVGAPGSSNMLTVRNSPPVLTGLELSPTAPLTHHTLAATVTASDPDPADVVTVTWAWSVAGREVKRGPEPFLEPGATAGGDRVRVTAVASDGSAASAEVSAEVTIGNSAPGAPVVRLTPRRPVAGVDDLRCEVVLRAADPDGDTLSHRIRWTRDGAPYPAPGDLGPRDGVRLGDTVPGVDVGPDEAWACEVEASDGSLTGPPGVATARAIAPALAGLAAATDFTCALDADLSLRCWGDNRLLRATPPSGAFRTVDVDVLGGCALRADGLPTCWGSPGGAPLAILTSVSVGRDVACGLTPEGAVRCWGTGPTAADAPTGTGWRSLAVGRRHACAITPEGEAWCWGEAPGAPTGPFLQLVAGLDWTCGLRVAGDAACWGDAPAPVPPGPFVELAAGVGHACALDASGAATCWGEADPRVLDVPAGPWARLAPGHRHACGVREDGEVRCWGDGGAHQLLPHDLVLVDLAAGDDHTCGITVQGEVACWGDDQAGQATPPAHLPPAVQVVAGRAHTCALGEDGGIACWGDDALGQLAAPGAAGWRELVAGRDHTCALDDLGAATCWGDDQWGQASIPPSLSPVAQLAPGVTTTCGRDGAGAVTCWGTPAHPGHLTPTLAAFLDVTTGPAHACGVGPDGFVACWGSNSHGQATLPGDALYARVFAGDLHTCGLRRDRTVRCWGGTADGLPSVPTGTFMHLTSGARHACGLRDDGRPVCWGAFTW